MHKIARAIQKKRQEGFTLVEIMIVVLIIGIILAIAIPAFISARNTSRAKACQANLKQIQNAKDQWAMKYNKLGTDVPAQTDLTPEFIKKWPQCPAQAAAPDGGYTINAVDTDPVCKSGLADHVMP